jgi:hexokinase
LIGRLNKYGICVDPTKKYTILDDIGEEFIDKALEMVKSGDMFFYVLDNIDWEEQAHDMRTDAQNKSVHAVATSIVFSRIPIDPLHMTSHRR